jgi:hypothetical protein
MLFHNQSARLPPHRHPARILLPVGGGLAIILLALAGCLSPPADPGDGALHRHNWWNYYARGLQALRQERVAEAADDFRRCLGLVKGARFGNDRDRWRARTYGLHFVEGYFPNRELGVCLYEQRDDEGALRHLGRSLEQAPSGRAKHYLNLARARQLSGRSLPAPRLRLDLDETASAPTRDRALTVSGVAEGEGFIRRLAIGHAPEFIELAVPTLPFSRRVSLAEGTNRIEVTAADLSGRGVTRHIVRVADWQPPRVLVRTLRAHGSQWVVEGVCRDPHGVASVLLDGVSVLPDGTLPATDVPLRVEVPADGALLSVTDAAGNLLTFPLAEGAPAAAAPDRPSRDAVARLAFAAAAPGWAPFLAETRTGRRGQRVAGVVPPGATVADADDGGEADRLRPSLVLRGCQPLVRVFAGEFFVDGVAADGGGLVRVTVNGENLLAPADEGVLRAYFARRLALDPGTNRFEIAATDRQGNRTAQQVTVIRMLPEHLDARYRLTVGVPPLIPAEAGPAGFRVKRRMEAELTREPVRFRLLERDEGWDYVLREQGLSLSDLADPAAALRIGKLLPAELLLMGTLFIEPKGVTVFLRAVETENGEIVFTSDVYSPDAADGLDEAVAGLVLKVGQGFPLVSGQVWKRQGTQFVLNVGRADGTTEKSRFLVFDAGSAAQPEAVRLCKADGRPVQLRIERLQQTTSTASAQPSGAEALVKEGCHVYSR